MWLRSEYSTNMRNFNITDLAYVKAVDESSIVTNGLILYFEAANKRSYNVGTTVLDLSGKGNHGIWSGTPVRSDIEGGVFGFSGGSYINAASVNLYNGAFTIMNSARWTGGLNRRTLGGISNNWLLGHWNGYSQCLYSDGWVTAAGAGPTDTVWRIYTGLGNTVASTYSFYVNGVLNAGPNSNGTHGPFGLRLGSDGFSNEYSNAYIGFVLAYNRVLTLGEIQQNYRVMKGRYGLL